MSYHNGSVWPHDTALCAAGMARYGDRGAAAHLLSELFDAAIHFELRLPELYCGFVREPGEPPVAYPVACLPQAWSSGAVFMLLQASLGVTIDGLNRVMRIDRPVLPGEVERLALREIAVGDARVDVAVRTPRRSRHRGADRTGARFRQGSSVATVTQRGAGTSR